MPYDPVDPGSLSGEALQRWYRRAPDDVDAERQAAARARYDAFFGSRGGAVTSGLSSQPASGGPGEAADLPSANQCIGPPLGQGGFLQANRRTARPLDNGPVNGTLSGQPRQQPLPPGTPPLPTYFSTAFGGAVPLHGPNGQVTGYYNHEAGREGMNITGAYAAIAPLFLPGSWMEAMPADGGAVITNAIREGIDEPIHMHHVLAKFLGGPEAQEREALRQSLHIGFHQKLAGNLKEAGFLNVGGKGGSTTDWANHFAKNAESFDRAIEILRRTSQEFDKTHGTSILPKLDRELAKFRGE